MAKGGVVSAEVGEELSAALWKLADRSGQNVPLLSLPKATLALHDAMFEEEVAEDHTELSSAAIERPVGMRFEFIELCGGAGVVTKELVKRNVVCGPVFDISFRHFDLGHRRVIQWINFHAGRRQT